MKKNNNIIKYIWPFSFYINKINELNSIIKMLQDSSFHRDKQIEHLSYELKNKAKIENDLNAYVVELNNQIQVKSQIEDDLNAYVVEIEKKNQQLIHDKNINTSLSSANYWIKRYESGVNSGSGSYNRLAEFKADVVNTFLSKYDINSVIEIGCGDGNQLSLINYKNYTGVDISAYIIEQNKICYADDSTKKFWHSSNRDAYINQKYDLSISMDVIFHLLEDEVFVNYLSDLFGVAEKYVIIYSSNHEEYTKWPEYRHRNFTGYVSKHMREWELIQYIPNKYPYIIGCEDETSAADFYIFEKRGCSKEYS